MSDEHNDVYIEPEGEDGVGTTDQKLKKLRDEMKVVKKERDDYLSGWQRSKADYVNLSKRTREGSAELARNAIVGVASGIVGVFDSLEAAIKSAENAPEDVKKGIEQVATQLESTLKEQGILRFTAKIGNQFDPEKHEPVQTVATEDKNDDNTISESLQSGYEVGDYVIRPARVSVKKFTSGKLEEK